MQNAGPTNTLFHSSCDAATSEYACAASGSFVDRTLTNRTNHLSRNAL
jgi:hypothetical protein